MIGSFEYQSGIQITVHKDDIIDIMEGSTIWILVQYSNAIWNLDIKMSGFQMPC